MVKKQLDMVRLELTNALEILRVSYGRSVQSLEQSIPYFYHIIEGIVESSSRPDPNGGAPILYIDFYWNSLTPVLEGLIKEGRPEPALIMTELTQLYTDIPVFLDIYKTYRLEKPSIYDSVWRKNLKRMIAQFERVLSVLGED